MKFIGMIIISVLLMYGCTEVSTESPASEPVVFSSVVEEDVAEVDDSIDVDAHDAADDCYTVIDGRVYDITEFIENSPEFRGSVDMDPNEFRSRLSMVCGTDGTVIFEELYGENHMRLDAYYVGDM